MCREGAAEAEHEIAKVERPHVGQRRCVHQVLTPDAERLVPPAAAHDAEPGARGKIRSARELVAQTRIESGVHSFLEVVYGGILGALSVLVIFQVFG